MGEGAGAIRGRGLCGVRPPDADADRVGLWHPRRPGSGSASADGRARTPVACANWGSPTGRMPKRSLRATHCIRSSRSCCPSCAAATGSTNALCFPSSPERTPRALPRFSRIGDSRPVVRCRRSASMLCTTTSSGAGRFRALLSPNRVAGPRLRPGLRDIHGLSRRQTRLAKSVALLKPRLDQRDDSGFARGALAGLAERRGRSCGTRNAGGHHLPDVRGRISDLAGHRYRRPPSPRRSSRAHAAELSIRDSVRDGGAVAGGGGAAQRGEPRLARLFAAVRRERGFGRGIWIPFRRTTARCCWPSGRRFRPCLPPVPGPSR